MIHVRPLDGRRDFQRHLSKLVGGHLMRDLCLTRKSSATADGSEIP